MEIQRTLQNDKGVKGEGKITLILHDPIILFKIPSAKLTKL